MAEWNMTPQARWNIDCRINSIAPSPDGTRFVSATEDNHLRVWDAYTNDLVLGPLKGHTHRVNSVACSSDGTRIVSGSYDLTIRIWDAHTGAPIGKPLIGHTSGVKSVAVSPDSTYIITGSFDASIRMWDVHTGALIGEPLETHTGGVNSVAISPDSALIISGSVDATVRIWDAHTGAPIGEPLRGHNHIVQSVAFSLDGTLIASGGIDTTLRIWDVRKGSPVGKPMTCHTSSVTAIAFLPDGAHVVSSSYDGTIRIWDIRTSSQVDEPLGSSNTPVSVVTVLPRSKRIVCGSHDGTICIWESQVALLPGKIAPHETPSFDMVTSKMSAQEMFECLVKHGCQDLTASVDDDGRSSSVIASGGFGDVRRLTLGDGTFAAVKTLRLHILLKDDDKGIKRAMREVYFWSRLHHPNVQELLGIVVFRGELGMVSLWMEQGNLQQYITAHPGVERYPLCIQLVSGVSYLHEIGMVHGDLKANNVLVSADGSLKINDFDHAILSGTTLRFSTTTRPGGGTFRWMAPELYEVEEEEKPVNEPEAARTKETDIYALGMTILEIYTGKVPFIECRTDAGVCTAILQKRIPRRPSELSGPDEQTKQLWQLLKKCWDYDPAARPNASSVLEHLQQYSTRAA